MAEPASAAEGVVASALRDLRGELGGARDGVVALPPAEHDVHVVGRRHAGVRPRGRLGGGRAEELGVGQPQVAGPGRDADHGQQGPARHAGVGPAVRRQGLSGRGASDPG
eukprot:136450-Lingulodinium_polyedra.AAC.1